MPSPAEPRSQNNEASTAATGRRLPFLTLLVATGLYSGFSPVAPGTAGSLVGLAVYALPGLEDWRVLLPLVISVFVLGVVVAGRAERVHGHDPAIVSIDEIVGMWVSLLFVPKSFLVAGTAFALFRFLDIVKPFPARRFDEMSGGTGIMLDDVVAGVYTNVTLHILLAIGIL